MILCEKRHEMGGVRGCRGMKSEDKNRVSAVAQAPYIQQWALGALLHLSAK